MHHPGCAGVTGLGRLGKPAGVWEELVQLPAPHHRRARAALPAAVVPGMLMAGADPRAAGRGLTAWLALFLQAWLPQLGFQDVPAGRAFASMPTLTKILFFSRLFPWVASAHGRLCPQSCHPPTSVMVSSGPIRWVGAAWCNRASCRTRHAGGRILRVLSTHGTRSMLTGACPGLPFRVDPG